MCMRSGSCFVFCAALAWGGVRLLVGLTRILPHQIFMGDVCSLALGCLRWALLPSSFVQELVLVYYGVGVFCDGTVSVILQVASI